VRVLFLHVDYLEYEVKGKALKDVEDVPAGGRHGRVEDALVCFITAEARDEKDPEATADAAAKNIEDVAGQVKTRRVALYPYAHLSSSLARPAPAQKILDVLARQLKAREFDVHSSPFGYYKAFQVSVKGHPLSELSREIVAEADSGKEEVSEAVRAEQKLVSRWFVLEPDGRTHALEIDGGRVVGYDFAGRDNLAKFAAYEMAKSREAKEEPPHVRLMRDLELVDYEPGSDPGNLRFYPKGRMIKALLEDLVSRRVAESGALEVESPVMYDFEHPALASYLARFPARQYVVQTPNKRAFLRFSACFGQFLIAHDMVLSYKQLPLALYELTRYSFRAEQRGEVAGLRRLRAFTMPDCHALCADLEQAKEQLLVRLDLAWALLRDIGFAMPDDFELGLRVTDTFLEEHPDFIAAFARRWGKPILMERWSQQFFYFALKYEFNFVDANAKAAALTTDQIDTENGKRFEITFVDAAGKERHPYILHLSPSGAIERVLYALLEKAGFDIAAGRTPMLPVWLSPTQVRLMPVSLDQMAACEKLLDAFPDVRADLDDSGDSLAKKVRRAEKEWIPYVAVVGEKEVRDGTLNVRVRATREQRTMTAAALQEEVARQSEGRPYRPLPLPKLLSRRPTFRG